jgi:hypothetical protein
MTSTAEKRQTMEVTLSKDSLEMLGDIIAQKIIYAKQQPEPWITLEECAKAIGKAVSTMREHSRRKNFPCLRGRPVRVRRSQVEEYFRGL